MKLITKSVYPTFMPLALALTCFAFSPAGQVAAPEPVKPDEAARARLIENYGKFPLSFEANKGQQDRQVKFLSRGSGYNLFLTNRDAVLVLTRRDEPSTPSAGKATLSQKRPKKQSIALRMRLLGANPEAKVTGEEELPGKVNYFIGNDPSKWCTDVATYAKVRYEQVYPGIDLVYYGNQRQLEYDFVVAPEADPDCIRLRVAGARKMYVNGKGQLVVKTASGAVRWNKPEIYQEVDGQRRSVKGKYVLRRGHELGFEVGAYDTARLLVIDPSLVYSTYLGGSSDDFGYEIAVDTSGNAYVTGYAPSSDFPTTPGAFQTTKVGAAGDAFVTKLNSNGTDLIYSTYLGGDYYDYGYGIAVDTSGNAYVTGKTQSHDFPVTAGAFQTTYGGGSSDAFVTKLNSSGTSLVYSTYLGGGGNNDSGNGIALDAFGNAYIIGTTPGSFPTTVGAFQTTYGGGSSDVFVTKLNSSGTSLVYSSYLGGSGPLGVSDVGYDIALDTSGNAYVTGYTQSDDFPTTPGAFQTTRLGARDVFVTKFNFTGSDVSYSTYLGGDSEDYGYGIAVDTSGNAHVTGQTHSNDFPTTPGAFQTTNLPEDDGFVTKLNSTGTDLVYSTYLGGNNNDSGNGIAVDTSGNAYVTGYTPSTDFPTTPGAFQTTYVGLGDAFVTKFNGTGSGLLYSTYLGGTDTDSGRGVALDTSGNAYVVGDTKSSNFPVPARAFQTTNNGGRDAFVAKINPIVLKARGRKVEGINTVRLTWSGTDSTESDIYRNGAPPIATVPNRGKYIDSTGDTGQASYTYKVCEAGTSICSNTARVTFQE